MSDGPIFSNLTVKPRICIDYSTCMACGKYGNCDGSYNGVMGIDHTGEPYCLLSGTYFSEGSSAFEACNGGAYGEFFPVVQVNCIDGVCDLPY